jgi:hypothetical protein
MESRRQELRRLPHTTRSRRQQAQQRRGAPDTQVNFNGKTPSGPDKRRPRLAEIAGIPPQIILVFREQSVRILISLKFAVQATAGFFRRPLTKSGRNGRRKRLAATAGVNTGGPYCYETTIE